MAHTMEPERHDYPISRSPNSDQNESDFQRHEADEEDEEKLHFEKIINAFRLYRLHFLHKMTLTSKYCTSLDERFKNRLVDYHEHIKTMKQCILQNSTLLDLIINDACKMFENRDYSDVGQLTMERNKEIHTISFKKGTKPSYSDMDKTTSVLRQIVREWTIEGREERQQSFGLLIDAVERYFNMTAMSKRRSDYQVLVPGAGLGRLVFELAKKGFASQGNEYSFFMLFTSNFILNKCKGVFLYDFYPWIHQVSNNMSRRDQVRKVSFPDEDPSLIPSGVSFSMTAGNFVQVYSTDEYAGYFNCIVTCFFIDTAHNILEYIDIINKSLADGGLWINLGPLLYHFSEMEGENSIEPPYDLLKAMISKSGFEFLEERTNVHCSYTQNSQSMLSYLYNCVFFVCRKVPGKIFEGQEAN